jgi:hypothetical protein
VALALSVHGVAASSGTTEADNKPSDWISAIGSAVGAIGTAGALWLGAITFRRQVRDQHRAQASAISVAIDAHENGNSDRVRVEIRNDSPLPIYGVILVAKRQNGADLGQELTYAMPTKDIVAFHCDYIHGMMAYADFTDSAGSKWRRYFTGELEELATGKGPSAQATTVSLAGRSDNGDRP